MVVTQKGLRVHILAVMVALILFSASMFADVIVYMQPPTLDGTLLASQNDPGANGNFATVYDNFVIMAQVPYQLTDVHWFGGYFNPPNQGPITGWTITFYADAVNQPGSVIWSRHYTSSVSEDFLGNFGGFPYFSYHQDDIKDGFTLQPNTMYWLSLVPDLPFPPQWGWGTGKDGDGMAYQDFFGTRTQIPYDMGFDISADTPEPGTLILLGSGLAGLAGMLRRRLF